MRIMKKNKIKSIAFLITWMIVIFIMSSFAGDESSEQSNIIVDIIVSIFNIENITLLSLIIRKLAHITEFLILGILFCNVMKQYNKNIYWGVLFSFLYAISDEIHQHFVPGRACQITDMLIDLFGIILGLIIYKLVIQKKISV